MYFDECMYIFYVIEYDIRKQCTCGFVVVYVCVRTFSCSSIPDLAREGCVSEIEHCSL